jgi:hypothetical protein
MAGSLRLTLSAANEENAPVVWYSATIPVARLAAIQLLVEMTLQSVNFLIP